MRNPPRNPQSSPVRKALGVVLSFLLLSSVAFTAPRAEAAASPPSVTMVSRSRSALALSWTAVDGAVSYRLRYSTSSRMHSAKVKTTQATALNLTGLRSHKGYYIQVRAVDALGVALTGYSKPKKFWTLSKSGFSVLPPSNTTATAVGSTSLRIAFTPVSGAAKYLIGYSTSRSFSATDRQIVTSSPTTIPGLLSDTVYYLHIRALSSSGKAISYYSDHFTKSPTTATTGPAYQSGVVPGSKDNEPLRVASYNIKCAGCEDTRAGELGWNERRGAVADTILAEMPDVVGVQEATQGNLAGSTLNQYDDLLALLGDPYRVTNAYRYNCRTSTSSSDCSYVDRGASQSVRIIYNAETLKLLVGGSLKLAAVSSSDNPRYLAWAQFTQISTGKTFFFGTTHLQPNTGSTETYVKAYADLREKQARQIVAHLAEVAGAAPVIVTGDMNTRFNSPGPNGTTGNPQYAVFTGAGFHDPLNGGTAADREKGPVPSLTSLVKVQYNSCNSYSRTPPSGNGQGNNIDYIYLKGGITATGWETALDLDPDGDFDGIIPSDHNLIAAEVVLP